MADALNYLPMVLFMGFSLYYVLTQPPMRTRITRGGVVVSIVAITAVTILSLVIFWQPVPLIIGAAWLVVLGLITCLRLARSEPHRSS